MAPAGVFLWCNVLVFGGAGLAALAAPAAVLSAAGVELAPGSGVAEIRAFYGGGSLGLAVFFGYCAARDLMRPGLWAAVMVTGGALAGRVIGVAVGGVTADMLMVGGFEVLWSAVALWLLTRTPVSA